MHQFSFSQPYSLVANFAAHHRILLQHLTVNANICLEQFSMNKLKWSIKIYFPLFDINCSDKMTNRFVALQLDSVWIPDWIEAELPYLISKDK